MISSSLVKVYFTEGYYENSDIKTLVGIILNKTTTSVTICILDKQVILNWAHVIKIENISNKRGPPWDLDFRKM